MLSAPEGPMNVVTCDSAKEDYEHLPMMSPNCKRRKHWNEHGKTIKNLEILQRHVNNMGETSMDFHSYSSVC